MRQIKFRAWNKEEQKMLIVTRLDFMNYVDDRENKNCEGYWGDNHRKWFDKNDTPLMQFTGLLDKNGKKIYEGDIISFVEVDEDSAIGREEKIVGDVQYFVEMGQYRLVETTGRRRELGLVVDFPPVYDVKVIGNIYENPELLSKE